MSATKVLLLTRRAFVYLMLLSTVAACRATEPETFHIQGTVLNRSNRSVAPGITVAAYYEGGCGFFGCSASSELSSTVTDAAGRFSLDFNEDGDPDICNPFAVAARSSTSSSVQFGIYEENGRCAWSPSGEITLLIGPA